MTAFEDRVAINDVLARYADAVNQRDAVLWASTWDVQAEWFLFGPDPVKGRDAIIAAWVEAMAGFPFVIMTATQGMVVIDGDSAAGRSYTNEIARAPDGRRMRVLGCYEDRYCKRGNVWTFTFRRFSVLDREDY